MEAGTYQDLARDSKLPNTSLDRRIFHRCSGVGLMRFWPTPPEIIGPFEYSAIDGLAWDFRGGTWICQATQQRAIQDKSSPGMTRKLSAAISSIRQDLGLEYLGRRAKCKSRIDETITRLVRVAKLAHHRDGVLEICKVQLRHQDGKVFYFLRLDFFLGREGLNDAVHAHPSLSLRPMECRNWPVRGPLLS